MRANLSEAFETLGEYRRDVHLAPKRRLRDLEQLVDVRAVKLDGVGALLDRLDGQVTRALEAIRNADGVDAAVNQRLGLLEQRTGQHHDTGRSVTNLVVLALGQLDEQLCNLVLQLHIRHNRRTIVGHLDIAVRADQNLVETARTQRGAHNRRHRPCRLDMVLDCLRALRTRLLPLLAHDNEGIAVLVLRVGHLWFGHCRGRRKGTRTTRAPPPSFLRNTFWDLLGNVEAHATACAPRGWPAARPQRHGGVRTHGRLATHPHTAVHSHSIHTCRRSAASSISGARCCLLGGNRGKRKT